FSTAIHADHPPRYSWHRYSERLYGPLCCWRSSDSALSPGGYTPSMASNAPLLIVEDDPWTRLIGVVLDPATSEERRAAFADFMSPDEPDFAGWCKKLRGRAGKLYPSTVRLVASPAELRDNLASACALVVESCAVGAQELG